MKVAALLLLFTIWAFEKVAAAAAPAAFVTSETPVATTAVVPPFQMHQKPTLLQKLEWKLLQKKLKKEVRLSKADRAGTGGILSTIALLLAVLGIIALLVPSLIGFSFFLALGAVVLSIIGVAGKNRSRGARTKSIIALVLSGLLLLFWVGFFIAWAGFSAG